MCFFIFGENNENEECLGKIYQRFHKGGISLSDGIFHICPGVNNRLLNIIMQNLKDKGFLDFRTLYPPDVPRPEIFVFAKHDNGLKDAIRKEMMDGERDLKRREEFPDEFSDDEQYRDRDV